MKSWENETNNLVDVRFESVKPLLGPYLGDQARRFGDDERTRLSWSPSHNSWIGDNGNLGMLFFEVDVRARISEVNILIDTLAHRLPQTNKETIVEMTRLLRTGELAVKAAELDFVLKREVQPYNWNDSALVDPNSFWAEGLDVDLSRRGLRRRIGSRLDFLVGVPDTESGSAHVTFEANLRTRFDRQETKLTSNVTAPKVPLIGNDYFRFEEDRPVEARDLKLMSRVWRGAEGSLQVVADPTDQVLAEYNQMAQLMDQFIGS